MADPTSDVSNGQRALWTFLFYTLCGPFFAALLYAAIMILAPLLNLGALLPAALPPLGEAVTGVFIWSALPAALAALGLVLLVLKRGSFNWGEAAIAGVFGFAIAVVVFPPEHLAANTWLAFLAGVISLAVRHVLLASNILRAGEPS